METSAGTIRGPDGNRRGDYVGTIWEPRCRMLGPGVAWLAVLLAAALGNTANTLLLDSTHRSIGASTAVFATLGILAGYVWRGQLMAQDRWSTRYGPIIGGLARLDGAGKNAVARRRLPMKTIG